MGHFASYYKSKLSYVPWQPTDITGCKLWLKADAGVIKDGSNYVSAWLDQSGNGNHAVQAAGSAQPLWVDGVLNSKPVIRFDGLNDYLHAPIGLGITSTITLIVVYKLVHTRTQMWINKITPLEANSITNFNWDNGSRVFDGSAGIMYNGAAEGYYVFSTVLNGNNSTSYNNGVQNLNSPTTMGARDFNDIYIGAGVQNGWSAYDGEIAEKIIYDNAISASDLQLAHDYINTKYALW